MDPTLTGAIESLQTLGPAGMVGGAWIFSLLRQRKELSARNSILEDREYEQLKVQTAVLNKFAGLLEQEQQHHHGAI